MLGIISRPIIAVLWRVLLYVNTKHEMIVLPEGIVLEL
jgi:hypothetical protein